MSLSVMLQQLASGMVVSVEIFVVTLLFSLPLGLLICFGRMSKNPAIRGIVSAYISVMRGTPLMLQLMVVYFGPYFIFGIRISMGYSLIAVFIAFSINYAAYFAEIYRGGIESISAGQYEAAKILGYSKAQTFFRIILPQVIKRILPSVTNGKGYVTGICCCCFGDVYNCKTDCKCTDDYDAFCDRCCFLFCVQSSCCDCNG